MPVYEFEFDLNFGMSHPGEMCDTAKGKVELSDQEVDTLVKLIKEKGTADVEELELETLYPDIYENLSDAYYEAASNCAEMFWLWEGYYNGYFDYDTKEVMEYCKKELGFKYEEEIPEDADGEDDDYYDEDAEYDAFYEWKDNYVHNVLKTDDEVRNFFYNVLHANLDLDCGYDYEIEIPEEIVRKAEG